MPENHRDFTDEELLTLWGKTGPRQGDADCYHPLLFHLMDVGNVALLLWDRVLPSPVQKRIAATLGVSMTTAQRIVVLLAAQHDLGKLSAFQYKSEAHVKIVNDVGLTIIGCPNQRPHGYITAKTLPDCAIEGVGGWKAAKSVAEDLSRITGGHHGTFPNAGDLEIMGSAARGGKGWSDARRALLEVLPPLLWPNYDGAAIEIPLETLEDAAAVPLIGGLISVADWIASSQEKECFPIAFTDDNKDKRPTLAEYAVTSREQTKKALQWFGWLPTPQFADPADFGKLFRDNAGNPYTPNAMQEETIRRADGADEPYLMIIEEEMGAGKTEAAVYAIDRALTTGLAHGFYIAMPTQATGNQMFTRVHKYLTERKHSGNLNFQLVHSGNFLDKAFDKLKLAAIDTDNKENPDEGVVVAESWFTYKKRPLLAPFGVGTIDQTLLGVLQTKHWFVRLFGLAGKIVVFDEVHAYDVYTGALLLRLISWLRAVGCTVILLSATLPDARRKELVNSWDDKATVKDTEYPRITYVSGSEADAVCVAPKPPEPPKPTKTVKLERAVCDIAVLPDRLRVALPDGGCAAIICNTVARAQETFRQVREELESEGWQVTLFHARTPAGWRKTRERMVVRWFGKGRGKNGENARRPRRAVLIATQVVEQSLDLDFDWMASEMAPVDLLLQRMGRLFRHNRTDRNTYAHKVGPRFCILCDKNKDGLPIFPEYTELVYDKYALLRSYLALQSRDAIHLPADIPELIRLAYDALPPASLSPVWIDKLDKARGKSGEKQTDSELSADAVMISEPALRARKVMNASNEIILFDDDDPRVHETVRAATREGRPSISVICHGTDGHGNALAPKPKGNIAAETAREMLRFALAISNPGIYFHLKDKEVKNWKKNAYLRYVRQIPFDKGIARLETQDAVYNLSLDRETGLTIAKEGVLTEK